MIQICSVYVCEVQIAPWCPAFHFFVFLRSVQSGRSSPHSLKARYLVSATSKFAVGQFLRALLFLQAVSGLLGAWSEHWCYYCFLFQSLLLPSLGPSFLPISSVHLFTSINYPLHFTAVIFKGWGRGSHSSPPSLRLMGECYLGGGKRLKTISREYTVATTLDLDSCAPTCAALAQFADPPGHFARRLCGHWTFHPLPLPAALGLQALRPCHRGELTQIKMVSVPQ